ncbi:fibroblast growth factor receptor 1-like [Ptychodera flava]|uniref:fibroblast growth factor receptor 1-like n=1 Tax=Ptychodera flava TaxID=63121 RepID=UPI00396AA93C
MKTIPKHMNILEMIYCCTKEIPNCMVFEYCSSGTLKYHLLTCKNETENVVEDSILRNLYSFALQIAKGMSYLEDIECVHRTLSSKNVLVDQDNICKITELGLSSKVMTESTFESVTEGRLPIRWMALESILDCIYTSKTDVWSYGVVLWEIFTLGETPYSGITIRDIIKQLQQGYRLSKPDYSDEKMFGIIQQCWLGEAADRPTFHQLGSFIELGYFQNKNHEKIYEDVPDEDVI